MSYRVAICGIDGAGKSALVKRLYEHYSKKGVAVEKAKVDFICKTIVSEAQIFDDPRIKRVGMAFDFVQYYKKIDLGYELLLCDRYDLCYRVLNSVDLDGSGLIENINKIYDLVQEADLYIILDLPIEIAEKRLNNRGDRQNDESSDVLKKMDLYYKKEIKKKKNYVFLDAEKSIEEVEHSAIVQINKLMKVEND